MLSQHFLRYNLLRIIALSIIPLFVVCCTTYIKDYQQVHVLADNWIVKRQKQFVKLETHFQSVCDHLEQKVNDGINLKSYIITSERPLVKMFGADFAKHLHISVAKKSGIQGIQIAGSSLQTMIAKHSIHDVKTDSYVKVKLSINRQEEYFPGLVSLRVYDSIEEDATPYNLRYFKIGYGFEQSINFSWFLSEYKWLLVAIYLTCLSIGLLINYLIWRKVRGDINASKAACDQKDQELASIKEQNQKQQENNDKVSAELEYWKSVSSEQKNRLSEYSMRVNDNNRSIYNMSDFLLTLLKEDPAYIHEHLEDFCVDFKDLNNKCKLISEGFITDKKRSEVCLVAIMDEVLEGKDYLIKKKEITVKVDKKIESIAYFGHKSAIYQLFYSMIEGVIDSLPITEGSMEIIFNESKVEIIDNGFDFYMKKQHIDPYCLEFSEQVRLASIEGMRLTKANISGKNHTTLLVDGDNKIKDESNIVPLFQN